MHKTDSKIRLLFELTAQRDVQITSFQSLRDYSTSWKPEIMYNKPSNQYYYVFINDTELINIIKSGEKAGQENLINLVQSLENGREDFESNNYLLFELNENAIVDQKKFNEEKYIVFARINVDDFNFIYDYKKAEKFDLLKKNKPLIYADKGRIKEYLIGEKFSNNKNNNEENNNFDMDDDKKDEDNEEKLKQKKKEEELLAKQIPGNWFLINMNNLNYIKKNVYNNLNEKKLIKFISLIKYKEININEQENPNPLEDNSFQYQSRSNTNINLNLKERNEENSKQDEEITETINEINYDAKYQQPQEFAFISNDKSKLITVYQPKSCKVHNRKNDFWCKTCNKFCCLHCLPDKGSAQPNYNIHQGHKIHLLDEINSKIDEDINALDERIKNLMKIIEGEIGKKKEDIENLKKFDVEIKAKLKEIYEKENETIRQGELIRTKELAALVNEILRINDENIRRVNFLNKLFDNRSMTEYLTNFHIYKNKYVSETAKNLYILEKRVAAYMEKYKKNKYIP